MLISRLKEGYPLYSLSRTQGQLESIEESLVSKQSAVTWYVLMHYWLMAVAALLQADGERVDGRLHVRVLCIHQ